MKKIYFSFLLAAICLSLSAQTYVLEDFTSNQMPPDGWTIDNLPGQWTINTGSNAGGIAPEAMFSWVSGNNTSALISPVVDLTGLTEVSFQFMHMLDDYSGSGYTLGAATRSGSGDWNDIWTVNPTGDIGPELVSVNITNGDVGASDFQFCIFITGNTYNLDYWYIDDIWLYTPLNLDAGMSAITTSAFLGGPADVEGIFKNFGSTNITSAEVSWKIDEGETTTTSISGIDVAFGETYAFTCNGFLDLPIGSYNLQVWIVSVNGVADEDPSNDLMEKTVSVVSHTVAHRPCLEEFTSSTCDPCAIFNTDFVPWCNTHENEITLVKYQMNWPGAGDPYYTAEGGVRRDFYGVTWVPWTNLDGTYTDNNMGIIQNMFDVSQTEPALVSVVGSHVLNGTVMDIDVTVLPFVNMDNTMIQIAVFENLTHNNVGTNGETEFEHVMMKMVPNASGTITDLIDRVPFTITESVDLAGTNVEEWDDLGVAIIVQNQSDKYIWQSDYSLENAAYATDASITDLSVDGVTVDGFSPDVFDYTVTLPLGTVDVPVVDAVVSDDAAVMVIVPANELPGSSTVDVFAEDLATKNTYTVHFDIGTGLTNQTTKAIGLYPNPSQGKIYITGAGNAKVDVYSTSGTLIMSNVDAKSIVDLSSLDQGVYVVKILIDNQTIINKKISILK